MKICLKCLNYYDDRINYCPVCQEVLTSVDKSNNLNEYSEQQTQFAGSNMNNNHVNTESETVFGNPYGNDYVQQNNFGAQPAVYTPSAEHNNYNTVSPVRNSDSFNNPPQQKQSGNNNAVILALIAVFLVIIIVIGVFMLVSVGRNNSKPNVQVNASSSSVSAETTTKAATETTTAATTTEVSTTAQLANENRLTAYKTFYNFYSSYLDGINDMYSGSIGFCSDAVRAEMAERFEYNYKSVFDLRRIDFDEVSYSTYTGAGKTYHNFYVKCVSSLYDRDTLASKDYNYAVWYVTVTAQDGYYEVTALERNDKYKMNTDVYTITDQYDIF